MITNYLGTETNRFRWTGFTKVPYSATCRSFAYKFTLEQFGEK